MNQKKAKKLAPIDAKTFKQVCSLKRDNLDTRNFWILLDGGSSVVLCEQTTGEPSKGSLRIPKAQFDRMVRWYFTGRAAR